MCVLEQVYKQTPEDVTQYLANPDYMASLASQQNMKLDTLTRVRDAIVTQRPRSTADCVVWARRVFEDLFSNRIKQLLHNFPLDRCTPNGQLFWSVWIDLKAIAVFGNNAYLIIVLRSGAKKPPTALTFDLSDPLHAEFVLSAANMRAAVYSLPPTEDLGLVAAALEGVSLEQFRPVEGVKIAATDEEAKAEADSRNVQMHVDIDQQCSDVMQ